MPGLTDAMKQVSAAQQKAVKPVQQPLAATHDERLSDVLAAIPLAVQPLKGELAEGRAKRVFAVEQGTAYGLDAATGKTLWRRFVALDPTSTRRHCAAGPRPGRKRRRALRSRTPGTAPRQGATGGLLWRLAVGRPIVAGPVPAGKWLLLLTNDQRLLLIDPATGDSPRYFQLPQAVRLPPVIDIARDLIFLAADQSNLIVLEVPIGPLPAGLARGTPAGTIAAPPAIVGDFLLLPINDTPGKATVRVLAISQGKEGGPLKPVQSIRVEGSIDAAPVAVGAALRSSRRQCRLFALERNEAGEQVALPSRRFQGGGAEGKVDPLRRFRRQHVLGGRQAVDVLCRPCR